MDENRADKKRMFSLLDSYDYRLEEAVKEIENLRCLVVKWKWNAWSWIENGIKAYGATGFLIFRSVGRRRDEV